MPSTERRERRQRKGVDEGVSPERGPLLASYAVSPLKIYAIAAMLLLLIGLGLHRLLTGGETREDLVASCFLILLPLAMLAFNWKDARRRGPVLLVYREGFVDERLPAVGFVGWQRLQGGGDIRKLLLGHGLRVEIPDGTKIDIDLTLLAGRPAQVLRVMREAQRAHAGGTGRRSREGPAPGRTR